MYKRQVKTIAVISEASIIVAAAIEQQQASTSEIARNVEEASNRTEAVAHSIASVTEAASAADLVATRVFDGASSLVKLSDDLHRQVSNFIGRVRAS